MSDRTATDRLREMLDERGEPYTTNDHMGAKETSWRGFTAYQLTPSSKLIMHPTPEQAIAATLGSGTCEHANGGVVSRNYIDGGEEGPICPIPRTSVIFEGQKLTFDAEDSKRFQTLVVGHFRKLAGLGDAQ